MRQRGKRGLSFAVLMAGAVVYTGRDGARSSGLMARR